MIYPSIYRSFRDSETIGRFNNTNEDTEKKAADIEVQMSFMNYQRIDQNGWKSKRNVVE